MLHGHIHLRNIGPHYVGVGSCTGSTRMRGFYGMLGSPYINTGVPSHVELPVASVLGQVNGENISEYELK